MALHGREKRQLVFYSPLKKEQQLNKGKECCHVIQGHKLGENLVRFQCINT